MIVITETLLNSWLKIDPLFHKTSAAFDEGGVRGLLLNSFSVQDDTCELLLDSTAVVNVGLQKHLSNQTPTQIQGHFSVVALSDYRGKKLIWMNNLL